MNYTENPSRYRFTTCSWQVRSQVVGPCFIRPFQILSLFRIREPSFFTGRGRPSVCDHGSPIYILICFFLFFFSWLTDRFCHAPVMRNKDNNWNGLTSLLQVHFLRNRFVFYEPIMHIIGSLYFRTLSWTSYWTTLPTWQTGGNYR